MKGVFLTNINKETNLEIPSILSHIRLKISVSTDILMIGFYGYIGDISINIFT